MHFFHDDITRQRDPRKYRGRMFRSLLGKSHATLVFARRARILSAAICNLLPRNAAMLDVGSGDGTIAYSCGKRRSDLTVQGIDILVRPETKIPVRAFDGRTIPYNDRSFDVVSFIDILHHANDAEQLLREARRVSKNWVIVKDHFAENTLDRATLTLMDWVGNAPHGVSLPYNYWSRDRWKRAFKTAGLTEAKIEIDIPLYAFPLNWVFGRGLHFISLLKSAAPTKISGGQNVP
jgi:SAM-dependent methyltransferase